VNLCKTIMLPLLILSTIIPVEVSSGKLLSKKQTHKKHYEEEARKQSREEISKNKRKVPITVTKYNPEPDQTDSTPFIMASNKRVYTGAIALSRDLEKEFGFKFGDLVFLEGLGTYVFQDRMNKKWKNRADILDFSKKEAVRFGRKTDNIIIVR